MAKQKQGGSKARQNFPTFKSVQTTEHTSLSEAPTNKGPKGGGKTLNERLAIIKKRSKHIDEQKQREQLEAFLAQYR